MTASPPAQPRRAARRSLRLVPLAALATVAAVSEARAQTYTGTQVKLAVDPSIDILRDHVAFQAQQDRYDAMLGYLSMTDRFSPLRYASDDGTRTRRVAHRAATMIGAGYGSPSEWGFYAGAWTDWIRIGPQPKSAIQGLAFLGVGVLGFQATYAYFLKDRLDGLDPYGNFGDSKGGVPYYSYVPGGGIYEDRVGGSKDAISIYHTSGASLVVVRDTPSTGSTKVSEVRAQLQPLKEWLGPRLGLPMAAVQKLREGANAVTDPKGAAESVISPSTATTSSPWEVEVGGDDLFDEGIRLHAVARVAPTVSFARAEVGAYRDFGDLTAAARSFVFLRDGAPRASLDAFVLYAINPPGEKELGFPVSVGASYSFDSPDSTTFVPLPQAHVFGVQLLLGAPEIAKSVVPIVRPKGEAKNRRGGAK